MVFGICCLIVDLIFLVINLWIVLTSTTVLPLNVMAVCICSISTGYVLCAIINEGEA